MEIQAGMLYNENGGNMKPTWRADPDFSIISVYDEIGNVVLQIHADDFKLIYGGILQQKIEDRILSDLSNNNNS